MGAVETSRRIIPEDGAADSSWLLFTWVASIGNPLNRGSIDNDDEDDMPV